MRELRTFINKTIAGQQTAQNDIEYYLNEKKRKKKDLDNKIYEVIA